MKFDKDINIKELLPDFAEKHTCIFIVGQGKETLARNCGNGWEVKTQRCAQCGKCCKETNCPYLKETSPNCYVCNHPDDMPWCCVKGSGENIKDCKVKFEKVDGN